MAAVAVNVAVPDVPISTDVGLVAMRSALSIHFNLTVKVDVGAGVAVHVNDMEPPADTVVSPAAAMVTVDRGPDGAGVDGPGVDGPGVDGPGDVVVVSLSVTSTVAESDEPTV